MDDSGLWLHLNRVQRKFFLDALRAARKAALDDAEGYQPIAVALELLGRTLKPKAFSLGGFRSALLPIAKNGTRDHLATCIPGVSKLEGLYDSVQNGRNDAAHQGSHARHLVRHCVELALAIEEGLMVDFNCVADFMVREPACAQLWQPVAYARQQMLANSYSQLPILKDDCWFLLSDTAIARYSNARDKKLALRRTIQDAVDGEDLALDLACCVAPESTVAEAIGKATNGVVLIVDDRNSLIGIATSFDFL